MNCENYIEVMTDEHRQFIQQRVDFWKDFIFSCKHTEINKDSARAAIESIYAITRFGKPKIIFADSPAACSFAFRHLEKTEQDAASLTNIWFETQEIYFGWLGTFKMKRRASDAAREEQSNIKNWLLYAASQVASYSCLYLELQFEELIDKGLVPKEHRKYTHFYNNADISQLNWVFSYETYNHFQGYENEFVESLRNLFLSGCFMSIFLKGYCIVSALPMSICCNYEAGAAPFEFHNDSGPAIEFKDGYKQYFFNGDTYRMYSGKRTPHMGIATDDHSFVLNGLKD